MPKTTSSKPKPIVEILPSGYQPTKAELEADVSIPVDPERLADMVMRDVTVKVKGQK